MNFLEAFHNSCIGVCEVVSKDEALRQIALLVEESGRLPALSAEDLFRALKEREEIGSTGFELRRKRRPL